LESVTVKTCAPESPARTQTAIQLPAVLLEVKAKDADVVVPASMLVVCTNLMVTTATVKVTPLLATPPTVTTTFPVVAPEGTGTTMLVLPQVVGDAVVLLNVTVLVPCVEPKFAPLMVTEVPTGPVVGLKLLMIGAELTVKVTPLLATPPTVTTTFPVVAPEGTGTTMLVLLQLVGDAVTLLNVTVLVPCVEPKFVPLMVTDVPTGPAVGLTPEMFGVGLPPPFAGLKAARTAPQLLEADSVAEAATVPAAD